MKKMYSDREEGEIDSEEDGLRKRITELEEENAKYEKIRGYTDSYMDKYGHVYNINDYNDFEAVQRAGQVPTDVSSISSVEFQTPKKKKHKRNKKTKCKVHARRNSRCSHQRHKRCKSQLHEEKRHHHHHHHHNHNRGRVVLNPLYEQPGIETISLDSTDMSDYERDNYSIAAMEIESPDEDYNTTLPLSREELRLALGRGAAERKNNVCTLRERLQPDKYIPIENEEIEEKVQTTFQKDTASSNDVENVLEIQSDNSISIEEHELRLIALRSAIMKKHATRKKRNAEIAYSPTDFDDLVVAPISVVDSEIEELHGDMEISPASSPRLLLSPIHCDDEQNSNISLETVEQQIDTKPIDMDIVSSDSECEDNASNIVNIAEGLTHDIPLPPEAPPIPGIDMPEMTFNYVNHNSAMNAYDMYMQPEMHYSTPMDLPPPTMLGITPAPPPPAPPALPMITTAVEVMPPLQLPNVLELETNENAVKSEAPNGEQIMSASPKSANMDIITEDTQNGQPDVHDSGEDEEEAAALRALLLSQRPKTKTTKMNGMPRLRIPSPAQNIPQILRNHSPEIKAGDAERMQEENVITKPLPLQLPSLELNPCFDIKPTESILKEAVRRLKVKKTPKPNEEVQSICKNVLDDALTRLTTTDANDVPTRLSKKDADEALPRLTIKSFARCKDITNERVVEHSQMNHLTSTESSQSHDTNSNFAQLYEESRNSFELETHRKSTPEILGLHATSIENTAAHAQTQKRRLENDIYKGGRTLRIIELRQDIDNSSSQHSSEDSSNNVELEASKPQNGGDLEKPAKRVKTSDQVDPIQKAGTIEKERIQEHATNKEKNVGEKENKQLPKEGGAKADGFTNAGTKTKPTAVKAVNKLARAAMAKGKVSPLAAAAAAKTTGNIATKQLLKSAAQPQIKTTTAPPTIAHIVVNPLPKQLKIVKPNKIINKNVDAPTRKEIKKTSEASTQSRILTTSTLPNIKVNKLIIPVGGGAESSSEDEDILRHQTLERCIRLTSMRTGTPDSLSSILNENYYSGKIASNSQQQQVGEMQNDEISNTSTSAQQDDVMSAATETFEKKLEDFLKNMRSKTQTKSNSSVALARVRKISSGSKQAGTPTAVRSLPTSSQEEYKRLVHRMKILEKQKQLKKMQKTLLQDAEKYSKNKKENATQKLQKAKNITVSETATQTSNDSSSVGAQDPEEIANKNGVDESAKKCDSTETDSKEMTDHAPTVEAETTKANAALSAKLQTCEKVIANISNNIVKRLDKSLRLVNEAKSAKIAKLRHEQRLKELRLEMEQTQRKMKEQELKMSRIYPEICTNNEFITNLKQKRTKVQEMAMKLGKSVIGDDYRLNNNLKSEITLKTKGLATHIKLVNSLTYKVLEQLEKEAINKVNIEKETKNNACTNNWPETSAAIVQNRVPNASKSSENIDSATVSKSETKDEAKAECKQNESCSPEGYANAVDTHLINAQAAPDKEENCDNAKVVAPAHMEVRIDSVTSAEEEMPAPTCYASGSKEVQRQLEDAQQQENVADDGDGDVAMKAMTQTKRQSSSVRDYVSPLAHLKSDSGKWDPNDIICPYELMGQCEDKECSYRHLTAK